MSIRHLFVYGLCLVSTLCTAGDGLFGSSFPFPSIGENGGSYHHRPWSLTKDDHHDRGPRGPRGHRGKQGERGEKGEKAMLSPAFSEGVFVLASGATLPIPITPTPPTPSNPFVVPLADNSVDEQIAYDPTTNSFEILASGTYLAEFFLRVESDVPVLSGMLDVQGYVVVALRDLSSNTLFGITKLVPNEIAANSPSGFTAVSAFGTYQELLQLTQGMQLQLVVLELPTTISSSAPIQFDFDGLSPTTDEVAYLTLLKVT